MSFTTVVLAAGAGRRVGGPKALLRLGDQSFVDAVVARALGAGSTRVIVVVGHAAAEIEALVPRDPRVSTVRNPAPERGMLSSLRVGLAAAPTADAVLVWPVDHPSVRPETVARLLAAHRATPRAIARPTYRGRGGHPTLFAASIVPELLAGEAPEGARGLVRQDPRRVLDVPVEDEAVVRDVDTPSDLAALRARTPP